MPFFLFYGMNDHNQNSGIMKHVMFICIAAGVVSCTPASDEGSGVQVALHSDVEGMGLDDALVVFNKDALDEEVFEEHLNPVFETAAGVKSPVPAQWNDLDGDGSAEQLAILVDIPADGQVTIRFDEGAPAEATKRTHAEISVKRGGTWNERVYEGGDFVGVEELRVPPEHTDHSFYIRYEGPGWESDKVGYRYYLDWRNATDIFGKRQPDVVLHEVGLDGFDSYHEMADWGMDILKVGESLGIGSLGRWSAGQALRVAETDSVRCTIVLDGPVQSMIRTIYSGWQTPGVKTDVASELSIAAGSRMTRHDVSLTRRIDSLCTGIVKHEGASVLVDTTSTTWGYLATWGVQSLNNDKLGMAIFFRNNARLAITEDAHSHVVVLSPTQDNTISYWFAACWELEPEGITTKEAFVDYLGTSLQRLAHPVQWNTL